MIEGSAFPAVPADTSTEDFMTIDTLAARLDFAGNLAEAEDGLSEPTLAQSVPLIDGPEAWSGGDAGNDQDP